MRNMTQGRSKLFLIQAVLMLLGLTSFRLLTSASFEATENVTLITVFSIVTVALSLIAALRDLLHVPSLLAFGAATVTLIQFLAGRVSYLAFYFSGDVMNTGLSGWFIVTAVCFLAGMILSIRSLYDQQAEVT